MTLSRVGEPGYSSGGRDAERSGQPVSLRGTAGAGRAKPTRSTTAVRSTETLDGKVLPRLGYKGRRPPGEAEVRKEAIPEVCQRWQGSLTSQVPSFSLTLMSF